MPTDHRTLPRKKRPASLRDHAIYIAYHSQGLTQAQLAKQFHLSQRRISTIIQRVDQSGAGSNSVLGSTLGPQYPEAPASPCLASASPSTFNLPVEIARASAQAIYTRALRSYDHAPAEITTTQTGHRGQSPFKITTRRQLPPNHHFLKAALNASANLTLLATQPPPTPSQVAPSAASNYSNCSNPTSTPATQPPPPQPLPTEIQKQENSGQLLNSQEALSILLSYLTPQPSTAS